MPAISFGSDEYTAPAFSCTIVTHFVMLSEEEIIRDGIKLLSNFNDIKAPLVYGSFDELCQQVQGTLNQYLAKFLVKQQIPAGDVFLFQYENHYGFYLELNDLASIIYDGIQEAYQMIFERMQEKSDAGVTNKDSE
jgi:hypothetical protein